MVRAWSTKHYREKKMKSNIDALLAEVDLTPDSLQGKTEPAINNAPEPELTNDQQKPTQGAELSDKKQDAELTNDHKTSNDSEQKESATDDYGNSVAKKERTYTQAEVEQMMRDRNSRGEFAELEAERVRKEALMAAQEALRLSQSQQATNESEGEEDWKEEFRSLIKETLTAEQQAAQERSWRAEAQRQQAEFEIKFNTGAAKYEDFEQVVVGKPLTPQMVMATKAMSDPAAFIYAAAKTQAAELERISKIPDALSQAVELGKLEEKMRKSRNTTSSAPRPIEQMKGDVTDKQVKPKSVDDILRAEAQERIRARR